MGFSSGPQLTVEKLYKVKKLGVYPTNGVHNIHNKPVETTPNNRNVCNISFPMIFISVINQMMDGINLDPSQHGLSSSIKFNACTTYRDSYLSRVK